MTTFIEALETQETRTSNGMRALKDTGNKCVSLFYKIGASRGKDILPEFTAAYIEDKNITLRILQWSRDIRHGAGERTIFRNMVKNLANGNAEEKEFASKLMRKIPELGRWDDMFAFVGTPLENEAFKMYGDALASGNGLAAKWAPRKGPIAIKFRNYLGWSPKFYRKTLVNLTQVVESQMCSNDWDNIDFNKVPSLASARYKKAFARHTEKYKEWTERLASGDKTAKVNAAAVYPYDVIKGLINYYGSLNYDSNQLEHIKAQWDALPNYVGDANILPLVDVSGSMACSVGGSSKTNLTCMDVAVSLGLYCADKNKGKFKDTFLTFTTSPNLVHLKGDIIQKVKQMSNADWAGSTDIIAAFRKILDVAIKGNVPQEEMPDILLIMSDMQFNYCARFDHSAMESLEYLFQQAGYKVPKVVFWNINAYDNVPVKSDKTGAALVSGFSPAIMKAILAGDLEEFTPEGVMMKTIMSERYDL